MAKKEKKTPAEEAVEEVEAPAEEETFAYSDLAATEPALSESVEEESTEDADQAVDIVFAEEETEEEMEEETEAAM